MITKTLEELYRIFHELEKSIFKYEMEEPVILIQSNKKKVLGTCSTNKCWENKNSEDDKKYQITISAEHLNSPIEDIIDTLIHEMVHLHCSLQDIKETSNNSVYHNKRFKEEAEKYGLEVSKGQTVGWGYTKLKDDTKELIKSFKINEKVFDYYKRPYVGSASKKVTYYKYICECGHKISLYKKLNLVCGDCKKPFEERE